MGGVTLAALLASAGFCLAQTADLTIQTFDADINGVGINWGPSTAVWDADIGNPPGACYVTSVFTTGQDSPCMPYFCMNGGNPWYNAGTADFALYKSVQFDIKWDNTSDLTIGQFNDVSTWPLTITNSAGELLLNSPLNAGQIRGIEVALCGPGATAVQLGTVIGTFDIPEAAASGWAHITIPIDPTKSGLAGMSGIAFHKWINNGSGQMTDSIGTGKFWVDNIILEGTAAPPPPPTLSAPTKAIKGLNIFTSTGGLYDRQSAVLRQTSGLSWIGMASGANPVSYSFTIAGYPDSVNCEAWMFLIPNPAFLDNAPDWNETNCVKVRIQGNATNAVLQFQYKVGEDHQQAMYSGGSETRATATETNNYYYSAEPGSLPGGPIVEVVSPGVYNITNETGFLASVTNNGILGTWTIKFTSDTDGTLIAPNGTSSSFTFPAHNSGLFAEQASPGMYVYLGIQANNADAFNQAVVFSDFAISNTATPFYENFLTDTVLDTTNVWNTTAASGPSGVVVVPAGAASWLKWTLPANGFNLEIAPVLTDPLAWISAVGPAVSMNGFRSQLVTSNEIPAGNAAFFRLAKRAFTKLQVLLPGESPAPNTPTGKTGTPTEANAGEFVTITVRAVDSNWNPISSATDVVHLASSDSSDVMPLDAGLSAGEGSFIIQVGNSGTRTITASDVTDDTKTSDTSSTLTVN